MNFKVKVNDPRFQTQDVPVVPIWWSDDHILCLGWLPHVFVFFVTLCCPWAFCHVRLEFSYHTSYHVDISHGLYTLSISPKIALMIYLYLQYAPHGHEDFFFVGVWPNTGKFCNLSWLGVQVSLVDLTCWGVLPPVTLFSWIRHMV